MEANAVTKRTDDVRALAYEALRMVYDPELGVNVVDLGLIYGVDLREDGTLLITMTLTTPGCPMHDSLAEGVAAALDSVPGLPDGEIRLVFDPPWDPSRMTDEGRRELGWTD
jgi:metal-sulfur cluster biosynthetic enzyme